jgi:hypothetical protein
MRPHEAPWAFLMRYSKSLSLQRLATYPRCLGITCENPVLNADEIKRLSRMPSASAVAKTCKINMAVRAYVLGAFLSGGDGVHIRGADRGADAYY